MNPYLELLFVSFIFGSSGSFIKVLHLPSTTLTFFRLAVPTVILFFYLLYKKITLFRGNIKWLMVASLLNAARLLLYFIGFNLATIGNASLASSTGTLFLFLLSFLLLKEKVTVKKMALLLFSIAGLVILYSSQPISFANKDFVGMSIVVLSTAIYQFTVIIFKRELDRYSKTEAIFYQNVVGAIVFLPFLFINKPFPALWQISVASTSAFLIGLVAFLLYFSAIKKVSPTAASLAIIDVVLSVIFGVVLFGEHLTNNMIIGGLIILLTSFFISSELRSPKVKSVV
jgi:drug/metabolite transporter (DMT)-like permease